MVEKDLESLPLPRRLHIAVHQVEGLVAEAGIFVGAFGVALVEALAAGLVGRVEPSSRVRAPAASAAAFQKARVSTRLAGKSSTTSTPAFSSEVTCGAISARTLPAPLYNLVALWPFVGVDDRNQERGGTWAGSSFLPHYCFPSSCR